MTPEREKCPKCRHDKHKPHEFTQEKYDAGQRVFGCPVLIDADGPICGCTYGAGREPEIASTGKE